MSIAQEYAALLEEMQRAREGSYVRRAATAVLSQISPDQPTDFITTSETGIALAAICAANLGGDASWRRIDLTRPFNATPGRRRVVVEVVDAGPAWREAVERRVGDHVLVIPDVRARAVSLS